MAKDYVQIESIPNPIERQKASVATKRKQPVVAIDFEETESKTTCSKDSDESDEEFATEYESEKEDEEVPAKTTSKPTASSKDKGKGIQTSDTQRYVAINAFSPLFFPKKSES